MVWVETIALVPTQPVCEILGMIIPYMQSRRGQNSQLKEFMLWPVCGRQGKGGISSITPIRSRLSR